MNHPDPKRVYASRVERFDLRLQGLEKVASRLGAAKLACAVLGAAAFVKTGLDYSSLRLALLLALVALFTVLAVIHESVLTAAGKARALRDINADELRALAHEFLAVDPGTAFQDDDHPFSSDLDLFGPRGLFHALNRAATRFGAGRLAAWLGAAGAAVPPEAIVARQEAAAELAGLIGLRQGVLLHGRSIDDKPGERDTVGEFLAEPCLVLSRPALRAALILLPCLTLGAIGAAVAGAPWPIILVPILAQGALNRGWKQKVRRVHGLTSRTSKTLAAYGEIMGEWERASFRGPLLRALQDTLHDKRRPASASVRRLSALVGYLDVRHSEFAHAMVNNLFLWDLHCLWAIERWLRDAAGRVPGWFEAMGTFEALSSLATLTFNHPGWAVPEILQGEPVFAAVALGHPLIPEDERVTNDVLLDRPGDILVVTGPNMAGKSTFLKTVGVNAVLAFAGGPVCAGSLRLSPFRLYTSMKIVDSLDKSLSLFYVELRRLKTVLDAVRGESPVLFLLDEILKGTNALDRQAGAVALLRQLAGRASGIVATHDLKLTELEAVSGGRLANFHFDGTVEGDRLLFDYKLKPGPCLSSNALVLMRRIGIDI